MVTIAVPKKLFTGDTLSFSASLSDYPAPTWTATIYFQNAEHSIEFDASASGSDHLFARTATQTSAFNPGRYRWFVKVSDGTTVATIDDGWTQIAAGAGDERVDHRSFARKMLEAIEAALEAAATKKQLDLISYNFGSVSVQRDRRFLEEQRDKYARELQREEGGPARNRRHIKVRFNRP